MDPPSTPDLRLAAPRCPQCAEPADSVLESVLGDALLTPDDRDPNGFHYRGETLIEWDSQTALRTYQGELQLRCPRGHSWESAEIADPAPSPKHLERTVAGYLRSFVPWLARYAEQALAAGAFSSEDRTKASTLPARALLCAALEELVYALEPKAQSVRRRFRRQVTNTIALVPTPSPPSPE